MFYVGIVQLVRTLALGARGRTFESCFPHCGISFIGETPDCGGGGFRMSPNWPRGGMVDAPDLDVARRGGSSPSEVTAARGRGSKAWLK